MTTSKPELCRLQPCGCVVCFCEHETQCMGCGAKHCGTHPVGQFPAPAYQQPEPDVSGLVEALEYVRYWLDRRCSVQGVVTTEPLVKIEAALATHYKGGDV